MPSALAIGRGFKPFCLLQDCSTYFVCISVTSFPVMLYLQKKFKKKDRKFLSENFLSSLIMQLYRKSKLNVKQFFKFFYGIIFSKQHRSEERRVGKECRSRW